MKNDIDLTSVVRNVLPLSSRVRPRCSPNAPSAPRSQSSPHKPPQISLGSATPKNQSTTGTKLLSIDHSNGFKTHTHLPGFHNYRGQDFFSRVSQKLPSRNFLEKDLKRAAINYAV